MYASTNLLTIAAEGASTPIAFATNNATRMVLDASGNLGVGMTPSAWAANAHIIDFESDDVGAQASVGDFGGQATLSQNFYFGPTGYTRKETGYASRFYQYQTSFVWQSAGYAAGGSNIAWDTKMLLDASGRLLIGKTNTAIAPVGTMLYENGSTYSTTADLNTWHYYNTTAGLYRFYVQANGGISNYSANNTNISDEREKNQFGAIGSQSECVRHWEVVEFLYKDEDQTNPHKYGVIAQQVAEHCPEVIADWIKVPAADEVLWTDEDELPEGVSVGDVKTEAVEQVDRIGVKEQQMFWMLVKSHQEALDTIDALTARIEALEGA